MRETSIRYADIGAMFRHLSAREILIGGSAAIWAGLVFWFALSDRPIGDVLTNAINDIPFAVFVVMFVEYANKRDTQERNRARRRAIALSVQSFYINYVRIITAIIADGVLCSESIELPSPESVVAKANAVHAPRRLPEKFFLDPIPYAAFFICSFKGTSAADVYPRRPSMDYLHQLVAQVDPLYMNIFQLDNGFLEDSVVDSLASLKSLPLAGWFRHEIPIATWGYWAEDELNTAVFHLGVLQQSFSTLLGYSKSDNEQIIVDAVSNSLNRKCTQQARRAD